MKIILDPSQLDPLKPKTQFVNAPPPAQPAAAGLKDGFYCDVPGCKHATDPFLDRDALLAHKTEAHRPPATPPPRHATAAPQRFYCNVPGCEKSGRPFDTAFALQQHRAHKHGHAPAPPAPAAHTQAAATVFKCPVCEFQRPRRSSVSKHFFVAHRGQALRYAGDTFECVICNSTAENRNAICSHITRQHQKTMRGNYRKIEPVPGGAPLAASAQPAGAPRPGRSTPPEPVAKLGKIASATAVITVEKDFAREAVGRLLDLGFTKLEVTISEKL